MKVGAAARASHVNLLKYCNLLVFPDSEPMKRRGDHKSWLFVHYLTEVSNANYHCTNTLGKVT